MVIRQANCKTKFLRNRVTQCLGLRHVGIYVMRNQFTIIQIILMQILCSWLSNKIAPQPRELTNEIVPEPKMMAGLCVVLLGVFGLYARSRPIPHLHKTQALKDVVEELLAASHLDTGLLRSLGNV